MTRIRRTEGKGDAAVGRLSRRTVLQTGAAASGSLLLGGAASARRLGGSGFITAADYAGALDDDRTFKLLAADGWTLERVAGCGRRGKGRVKAYTGYSIRFGEGDTTPPGGATGGHVFVESTRRVDVGAWHDVTAARDCPPDACVQDDEGNATDTPVLKIAFRPTDFGRRAGVREGESITDGDDPDPDPAVVLAVFDVPISDWIVFGDETVAMQNPGYDPEDRVVVVAFEHLLDTGWSGWRDVDADRLFDGVVDRGIKFHAFPQSRLDRR